MQKIKVLIVDDDFDWLSVMENFLKKEDDIVVSGIATNKEDAIRLAQTEKPDVILMDIVMNGKKRDGIFATLEIVQSIDVKVIMLTCMEEKNIIRDSYTAGAVNYVLKEKYMDLPQAIRSTYNNDSQIETVLNEYVRLKKEEQLKGLTPAEQQIYRLVEKGYSRNQIEKSIFKAKSTIRAQIRTMLKKLGVKRSKEAVKKVNSRGLIKDE